MGDRVDQLKGELKEGLGKVTRNRRLEAQGEIEAHAAKARRRRKAAVQEVRGDLKEAFGTLTGDASMEAEGKADRVRAQSKLRE